MVDGLGGWWWELLKIDQMPKTVLQFSIYKKMFSLEGKRERENPQSECWRMQAPDQPSRGDKLSVLRQIRPQKMRV